MRLKFRSKISLTFFLVTALISSLIFYLLFIQTIKDYKESLRTNLKSIAALSAESLTEDQILSVPLDAGCETHPDYAKLVTALKKIRLIDSRIADAYVLRPTGEMYVLQFVANADRELTPVGCGERFDIHDYEQMKKGFTMPAADNRPIRDKWGNWFSGYAPIRNASGEPVAMLGLDIPETTLQAIEKTFFHRYVLLMVLALVLALFMELMLSQWLTRPLELLIQSIEKVAEGNLEHHIENFPMPEFDTIRSHFNKMTEALKANMLELTQTVRRQERVNRELEIAAEIQARAIPAAPPCIEKLDLAAKSIPAAQVGGDYYDFLPVSAGHCGFVIGDATGKGISGAIYMTTSRSVFRMMSRDQNSPANVLRKTNDFIVHESIAGAGLFMTLFYGIYESLTSRFIYANAGHNSPLWFRAKSGTIEVLKTHGVPIGIVAHQTFADDFITLETGDVLLFYTDGAIEAANDTREMFGVERLSLLLQGYASKPAQETLDEICRSLKEFTGNQPQHDDMTLVVLKKI